MRSRRAASDECAWRVAPWDAKAAAAGGEVAVASHFLSAVDGTAKSSVMCGVRSDEENAGVLAGVLFIASHPTHDGGLGCPIDCREKMARHRNLAPGGSGLRIPRRDPPRAFVTRGPARAHRSRARWARR